MSEPNIDRRTTPSKLGPVPSIERKGEKSGPIKDQAIQREAPKSRGTPVESSPTQRQIAQWKAEDLGIDAKGLPTREINKLITEQEKAQKELGDFINNAVRDLPRGGGKLHGGGLDNGGGGGGGGNRQVHDPEKPPKPTNSKDKIKNHLYSPFWCYHDGKFGAISLAHNGFVEY